MGFNQKELDQTSQAILEMFSDFCIKLELHEAVLGPNSSYFTFKMITRIRMKDFQDYLKDLQYAVGKRDVSIEAPMKDESLIRIEVENKEKHKFEWQKIIGLKDFKNSSLMEVPLGYTYHNKLIFLDLTTQPHMLIGGTTGSGKSVLIHNWICSIILKASPQQVRLILNVEESFCIFYFFLGHIT